ncbi:MAG TPA: ATP-binding cassette domain-containing protein [Polyangia bacterium]|nr:ATP-binding cassette domain-containing protein [Polyangia bacterium]
MTTAGAPPPSPAPSPGPVLEIVALKKTFPMHGLGGRRRNVLDDVSFSLDPGQIVALVGESGSGKSTLARIVARLERADAGAIKLEGADVLRTEPRHASLAYRARVQMVFQDPFASLNPVHRVRHHLARPLLLHGRARPADVGARVVDLVESVGLHPAADFVDRHPHDLSGGQRQRVAVARALAAGPKVIMADEPTSMLDASTRVGVLDLLRRLTRERGIAVLLITHDLATARHMADRIVVLAGGRVVEQGVTANIFASPSHPYTRQLLEASRAARAAPPSARRGDVEVARLFLGNRD